MRCICYYDYGRSTVAVIKRWPANTGPNTCYGEALVPINLAVL